MSTIRYTQPITTKDKTKDDKVITIEEPKRGFKLTARTIWIITIVIIVLVIAIAIYAYILGREETRVTLAPLEDITNLDTLIDISDGLCCDLPNTAATSLQYVYDPNTDVIYSTNITNPEAVCAGLTNPNFQNCVDFYSNEDGSAKQVAHFGIRLYYGFALGSTTNECDGFTPVCPDTST